MSSRTPSIVQIILFDNILRNQIYDQFRYIHLSVSNFNRLALSRFAFYVVTAQGH